jgi:glycosyltransferase involved in cell wall biosynthesis
LNNRLLVITDTKGQKRGNDWFIFNSVANELNLLKPEFYSITIILSDFSTETLDESLNKLDSQIKVIALPKLGQKFSFSKLRTLFLLPPYFILIFKQLWLNNIVHLRGPNTVTLITMPLILFFRSKKWWIKYATNWNNSKSPLNYRIQKWLLINVFKQTKVTINGFWKNLPKHILSFENPCLTELQVSQGRKIIDSKYFISPFELIFVGRIDKAKGVDILIDFIRSIDIKNIGFFHVVGEGELKTEFKNVLNEVGIPNKFYGSLSQLELFDILKISHCILLPSKSEGFPKVLAEAMNFGCIPLSSNVGSISHYLQNEKSGFILNELSVNGLNDSWYKFENLGHDKNRAIAQNGFEVSQKFTFEKYLSNLNIKIFNDN